MSIRFFYQAIARGEYTIPIPASAADEEGKGLNERHVHIKPESFSDREALEEIFKR